MNIPKLSGNSMETFFLEVSLLNLNFPLLLNRIPYFSGNRFKCTDFAFHFD